MKKCSKCGKENVDEAIYCSNCGLKLDSISISKHAFEDASNNDDSKQDHANFDERFKQMSGFKRLSITCFSSFLVALVIYLIAFAILGIPLDSYTEQTETSYADFSNYDLNGDGGISFDEIREYDSVSGSSYVVPQSEIQAMFESSDKNHNGLLKGAEFDNYIRKFNDYMDELERKAKSEQSSKSSSSSSGGRDYSSGSSKATNSLNNQEYDRSEGYVLTCPYCGSESVYESGGYYRCAECGSSIYNPDDLELGYWEGYMELLAPISLTIN